MMGGKDKSSMKTDVEKQLFYMWKEMMFISLCTILIGLCSVVQLIYGMVIRNVSTSMCITGVLFGIGYVATGSFGIKLSQSMESLQEEFEVIVTRNKDVLFMGRITYVMSILFSLLSNLMMRMDNTMFFVFIISSAAMLSFSFWYFVMYREERIIVFAKEIWIYNMFGKIKRINKCEIKKIDFYHNQLCYYFFNEQMEELFRMSAKMNGADMLIQNIVEMHANMQEQ